jgi:ActR/RegA family two-component response regulator
MDATPSVSAFVGKVLLVSNDSVTVELLTDSLQRLALFSELRSEVSSALERLNRAKFEAVIVDLRLGTQALALLEGVRRSASNKNAVVFTVSDSSVETTGAFRAGTTFVLHRPLSAASIDHSLRISYGLIVRERRRYFRCPVEIPVAIFRTSMPTVQGRTINVSENGMSITTTASLKPDDPAQLRFNLLHDEFEFVFDSIVRWTKEQQIGMQFTFVSPRLISRLQAWLSRCLEETIPQSVRDKISKMPE